MYEFIEAVERNYSFFFHFVQGYIHIIGSVFEMMVSYDLCN